jgi:hypothetical protein
MKKRHSFVAFALAVLAFGSGCGCHPVQRFRAAFPCAPCAAHRPFVHHHAPLASPGVPLVGAPCTNCTATPVHGVPVSYGHTGPGDLLPVTGPIHNFPTYSGPGFGVPTFGNPMPITPGPMVVPHSELPQPMPAPKSNQ